MTRRGQAHLSVCLLICGAIAAAITHPHAQATSPGAPAAAGSIGPPDRAAPRTDQNSMTAHAQLLEKARAGGIDVYFIGLKPILTELLGPPATADKAPPPTGAPSARPR
jgi:hypothetical protein